MYRTDKWIDAAEGTEIAGKIADIVVDISNRKDIPDRYLNSYRAAWIGHYVTRLLYKRGMIHPGTEEEQVSIDDMVKALEEDE